MSVHVDESPEADDDNGAGERASRSRPAARDIFDSALEVGEDELKRSTAGLAFSALAGGATMGLSGLSVAVVLVTLGDVAGARLIADLFYPIGFIAVIVGRQQLFTENTLFPVLLVLDYGKRFLANTARLWVVVFVGNQIGALFFAFIITRTDAASGAIVEELSLLGVKASVGSFWGLFFSGIIGGWIIALMAWMVTGAQWTISQVAIIWIMVLPVGIGTFAHSVAGAGEILSAVMHGDLGAGAYLRWLLPAALGNAVGGVVLVSVLNYAQVVGTGRDRERAEKNIDEAERDLKNDGNPLSGWLLGVGRRWRRNR